jgi:hypothetical protein
MIKKFILFVIALIYFTNINAQISQTSEGILFQAVATDLDGNPAKSRSIYIKDAIIKNSVNGEVLYVETFQLTTSPTGIFTIVIGKGIQNSGVSSIGKIDWSNASFFLNIKIAIVPKLRTASWDPNNNYVDMGTSQFWTVPFAMYAQNVTGADLKLNIADTAQMLNNRIQRDTTFLSTRINQKEALSNKSNSLILDGASNEKYPSVKAVKTYVDGLVFSNGILDGSIVSSQLADSSVTDAKIANGISASKVGLGNVNNTSDLLKPISNSTQLALDTKVSKSDFSAELALKSNSKDLDSLLALKANTTDLDSKATKAELATALALKANTSDLDTKASKTELTTGLADKANTTDVTTALAAKANTADLDLKATKAELTTALALKANISDLETKATKTELATGLADKANTTDLTTALALKANAADLDLKASKSELTTGLADKANAADVSTALALKANTSDLDAKATKTELTTALVLKANATDLDLKASKTELITGLAGKANSADVNTALALKANTADLDAKASKAELTTGLSDKVNVTDLTTALASKANTTDLDLKATKTELTSGLADKANVTEVNTALDLKASKTELITGLADKANTSDLDLKASKTELSTGLAGKVNSTDLTTALALKAPLSSPVFTGNITGNLVGNVTGNASTATTSTNIAGGGLGSLPYQTAAGTTSMIAGNTSSGKQFLTQTGNGISATAPTWASLSSLDVTNALGYTPPNSSTTLSTNNLFDFVTATATYTISNPTKFNTVIMYTGTSAPTFKLPDPAVNAGKILTIKYKNTNGSGNRTMIINPNGTETVDTFTSYTVSVNGGAIKNIQLITDGTNWLFLN